MAPESANAQDARLASSVEVMPKGHGLGNGAPAREETNVRVVARFRPPITEEEEKDQPAFAVHAGDNSNAIDLGVAENATVQSHDGKWSFDFDTAFSEEASQEVIYHRIGLPAVQDVLTGYNGTLLMYGQTGSGKTFSLFGRLTQSNLRGLAPRAAEDLVQQCLSSDSEESTIQCSFLEIYRERMRDLLHPSNHSLRIKEMPQRGLMVDGLVQDDISSSGDILKALDTGNAWRSVAATRQNQYSSRSHAIFTLYVSRRSLTDLRERTAKLSLVDLAGSERVCRSHCVGETLEEAKKINASLTALGKVIDALVERRTHVPYRDSTLTRVLEEALGGNSRTTLLVTASACSQYLDETVCSLRFAARAQKVRNSAHVNFVYSAEELWPLVAQLQKDLAQARRELHASKLLVPRRCSTASIAKFRRDSNSTEAESKEELILQVPKDPKAAAPDASWSSGMSRLSTVSAESPRSESSPSAPSDLRCLEDEEGTPMLRPLPNIWQGKGTASDVLQVALETVRTLEQVLLSQEEALEKAKLLRPEVLGAPGDRLSSPSSPLEGIGRFGIFGMEPLKGHVKICDLGCCLVLVSFILMVFVEEGDRVDANAVDANAVDASVDSAAAMSELPRHHSTASAVQEDQVLREKYSRWRDDHVSGRRRSSVIEAAGTVLVSYSTAETGGHLHSVGGFSVLQPPRLVPLRDDETPSDGAGPDVGPEADHAERQVSPGAVSRQSSQVQSFLQAASGEPSSLAGRAWRKAAGVVLALLAGSLTGVQSVPASLVNQRHKDAPATNVVFPQCLGIYICSSAIYLIYSAAAKLAGWRVPHSPIRPAYLSGCVWAVGFTFMITGISSLGFSIGYTLDAVGPIVIASLLSIFVFKEITDRHQLILYGIAFTLQVVGVICMSSASS